MNDSNEIIATGKRKCATASVRLRLGTGKLKINGKAYNDYFTVKSLRGYINQPLAVTETLKKFDFTVRVKGGGINGQAGALRHGIARALEKWDNEFRPVLKDCGMLTRDSRVKERKKPGQPGARKKFQFSKR